MREQKLSDEIENLNQTCEATLAALTLQISECVHNGTLDSRCAAKLIKRLKKEAEEVADCGVSTTEGRDQLRQAFSTVDTELCQHDAMLLVAAAAALRVADAAPGESAAPAQ